jgi:YgiT-type zinc finger domain-containing protein
MTNVVCPKTGAPMYRGLRAMTLTYKGESITFDMPGWYCDQSDESIHTGEDMKVSDRMLIASRPDAKDCLNRRKFVVSAEYFIFHKKPPVF